MARGDRVPAGSSPSFAAVLGALVLAACEAPEPLLVAAWGSPIEITYRGAPARVWLDPRARVRVIVTAGAVSELRIQPYLPAGVIVAPRGQPLGIETVRPFVDATADELRAAYPAQLRSAARDRVVLAWPPDDLGETFEVELGLEQGRVRRMQYRLHHGGNPAARQRLLELLEARYGAAKAIAGGRRQLRESPSVTVTEAEDAWWVDVAAVAPP